MICRQNCLIAGKDGVEGRGKVNYGKNVYE
jgi:hypothetical protein